MSPLNFSVAVAVVILSVSPVDPDHAKSDMAAEQAHVDGTAPGNESVIVSNAPSIGGFAVASSCIVTLKLPGSNRSDA